MIPTFLFALRLRNRRADGQRRRPLQRPALQRKSIYFSLTGRLKVSKNMPDILVRGRVKNQALLDKAAMLSCLPMGISTPCARAWPIAWTAVIPPPLSNTNTITLNRSKRTATHKYAVIRRYTRPDGRTKHSAACAATRMAAIRPTSSFVLNYAMWRCSATRTVSTADGLFRPAESGNAHTAKTVEAEAQAVWGKHPITRRYQPILSPCSISEY